MVKNDFTWDMKEMFHKTKRSKEEVATELGVSAQAIYQYGYHTSITGAYVEAAEALGYDIEVKYVPMGEGSDFKMSMMKLLRDCGETQTSLSKKMGITQQALGGCINNGMISKGFRNVARVLGYDIKLEFIKRD